MFKTLQLTTGASWKFNVLIISDNMPISCMQCYELLIRDIYFQILHSG